MSYIQQTTRNDPPALTKRIPLRRRTRETSVEIGSRIHSPAEGLGGRDSRDRRCHETPRVIERREQRGRSRFRQPPPGRFSRPWDQYQQGRRSRLTWRNYERPSHESREADRRVEHRSRSRDSEAPPADVIREMKRMVRRYGRQSD